MLRAASPRRRVLTLLAHHTSASSDALLRGHDPVQIDMMREELIRVTPADQVIGPASKVDCHKVQPDGGIPLHRAFSVFLFDEHNRLLMQQRSAEKITFPLVWTNTCCSHPLYTASEMEPRIGIQRAAQRKLRHELGIPAAEVPLSAFEHVATIHYKAVCDDGVWGEHEVDHVFAVRVTGALTLAPNANEVAAVRWFTQAELAAFRKTTTTAFSPWFARIAAELLPQWWDELERKGAVQTRATERITCML